MHCIFVIQSHCWGVPNRINWVWSHKTILIPSLFIEVPVPIQESERLCICVLGVSILHLSTILKLGF